MVVNSQQVQIGVINFVERELATKATGVSKFALYFILPTLSTQVLSTIDNARKNEMFKDYFNNDGNVEIDKVYESAKTAMERSGRVEYMGIIFNGSDVDSLYEYIKRG